MDFTRFLKIKPEIEAALADSDREVEQTKAQLATAQAAYDLATTQGVQLRTVLAFLNDITPQS